MRSLADPVSVHRTFWFTTKHTKITKEKNIFLIQCSLRYPIFVSFATSFVVNSPGNLEEPKEGNHQPRAFSMNCGRSALFQSGIALIFFSLSKPSAICCR